MFARMLRPSRRHVHEQISQNEDVDNSIIILPSGGDSGGSNGDNRSDNSSQNESAGAATATLPSSTSNNNTGNHAAMTSTSGNHVESRTNSSSLTSPVDDELREVEDVENEDRDGESSNEQRTTSPTSTNHLFRTSLLQSERDMRIRRQSTCSILIFFFLIRLWIETLIEKDVGLLFLSLISTMWTYRWFVNRREAEEEFGRQVVMGVGGGMSNRNSLLLREEDGEDGVNLMEGGRRRRTRRDQGASGADAAINFDPDLGLMSFQAQLALAILESQRQMFENGGYNGGNNQEGPGVTEEAKKKWQRYEWGADNEDGLDDETTKAISNYGSVNSSSSNDLTQHDNMQSFVGDASRSTSGLKKLSPSKLLEGESGLLASFDDNEQECPSCSICLCEYERGEKLIRLPCNHLYHELCLNSWTQNHVRCPLCNYDLMDGFDQPVTVHEQAARQHAEELREFRIMALSALGRRLRPRRTTATSTNRRGNSNGTVTASELAEATDDSIV